MATLIGAAPGAALLVIGALSSGLAGWLLVGAGLIASVVGSGLSMGLRLWRK